MNRRRFAFAFCVLLAAAGVLFWLLKAREPLYASSTAKREDTERLFQLTWKEFLTETPKPTSSLPVAPELPSVHVLRYPRATLIQMRRNHHQDPRHPTPVRSIRADDNSVVHLPGDASLRLAAFALSVPSADDPEDLNDPSTQQLLFREPKELIALSGDQLSEIGVPLSAREVNRAKRWTPMLRLVFVRQGLAFERITSWRAFDERSHANVSEFLERVEPDDLPDNFAILDLHVDIWHDTSLLIAVDLPCGKASETPIQLSDGFQIKPEPHINFQLLAAAKGPLHNAERDPDQIYLETETQEDSATIFAYRVFPATWALQMGLHVRSGDEETILPLLESELALTQANWPRAEIDDAKVLLFPERARALFRLDALPEMPNPRNVRNLFDVRIPRVQFGEFGATGESSLTYILLDTVSGATQTTVDVYGQSPEMKRVDDLLTRRFKDVSPRELIAEYQERAVDPYVIVSQSDHVMRFHRPEHWRHRLENLCYFNKPDWLRI
ncbi:MAG: hypothetical protein AAF585_10580 [Verrucomicrobiota bacterium]